MNKFITKIFKSAGVNAKVSKDSATPKFKVSEGKLTLEGVIRDNKYIMKIRDYRGKVIDNLSVNVSNSNDIVNRVNESLTTLKMLSGAYENKQLQEDAEEYDDVVVDDEVIEDAPESITDGLEDLYDAIMDVADKAEDLVDLADENDAEQLSTLIGFSSSLLDCAIDVDEYKDDLIEEEAEEVEDEEVNESFKKVRLSRGNARKALDNLTIAESLLRKCDNYSDIVKAIKDIKAEMIVRGR